MFFWSQSASAPAARSDALFVAIYIWVGVLSVLVPTQVWTLANYVMTTREAKRAFGLIGERRHSRLDRRRAGDAAGRRPIRHREHAALGRGHADRVGRHRLACLGATPVAARL